MVRVLLADDMPGVREVLMGYLGSRLDRYEVVGQAANGREALGLIDSLRPDIVIMDVNMPGMTGLEVILAMRTGGNLAPVILCSGEGPGPVDPGAGWVFRLPKPFRFELLEAALYAAASVHAPAGLPLSGGEL